MAWLEVVRTGPLATVQDRGRRGYGALGVGRSGAVDMISHDSANRLVGNTFRAATIEVTAGGFAMRAVGSMTVAATGARVPLAVDGRPAPDYASIHLGSGSILELGYSTTGLRTYISARGGVDVPQVLGSRSTDTLSGLGPPPLAAGDLVLLGAEEGTWPTEELIHRRHLHSARFRSRSRSAPEIPGSPPHPFTRSFTPRGKSPNTPTESGSGYRAKGLCIAHAPGNCRAKAS
ncbi:MAG: allophanate hydrolase subunit 2 [Rhodococcus sp. (in: high G+C Gram-positive bacteria)]|jgi:allophanate hydrolase subunit 2